MRTPKAKRACEDCHRRKRRCTHVVTENQQNPSDQLDDLSNHLVWLRDGKPGGMARFTEKLGRTIEDQYRAALVAAGYGDTLIAILRRAE